MVCVACLLFAVLLATTGAAYALPEEAVGRMVILEDQPVIGAFVDRVEWMGDGRRFILGGWDEWPKSPMVLAVMPDGAVTPVASDVANPYFAVSPDGNSAACWRKTVGGEDAQLVVGTPGRGSPLSVGSPVPAGQAMQIAWAGTAGEWIVYCQSEPEDKGGLWAVSLAGGGPRKLLNTSAGWWAGLAVADTPEDVIAVWCSKQAYYCRVKPRTGLYAPVDAFWGRQHARPGTGPAAWLDDKGALLLASKPEATPQRLVDKADAFCWARSGQALIHWAEDKLWVVSAKTGLRRKLLGMPTLLPLTGGFSAYGCVWSPDESTLLYWRNAAGKGFLRRAVLGTEDVSITFAMPAGTKLAPGSVVWVAERFLLERPGVILKPEWRTCKGQFQVVDQVADAQRVLVTAVNVGTEAGEVRRLTGSNEAPDDPTGAGHIAIGVGGAPTPMMRSFTAAPLPTIAAWPQGSKTAGKILRVNVTRRNLGT